MTARLVIQCQCGASLRWIDWHAAQAAGWRMRRENGVALDAWICPECVAKEKRCA